jgi:hypothetical protein
MILGVGAAAPCIPLQGLMLHADVLQDYVSLHRRAAGAAPDVRASTCCCHGPLLFTLCSSCMQRDILLTKAQPHYSKAQRLSHNRAAKQACSCSSLQRRRAAMHPKSHDCPKAGVLVTRWPHEAHLQHLSPRERTQPQPHAQPGDAMF